MNPTNILHDIYLREIQRLNEKSKQEPLDLKDIKALEMLSKAYSNFKTPPLAESEDDDLSDLSADEILERLNGTNSARENPAT